MAKSLEDMVRERYSHPEVQTAIMEEIRHLGHEEKILSGELSLPSEYDATRHVSKESHWEQADLHARSDSKRFPVGPNPAELEKARAETQRLLKGE
jgi:hypothetical protein